MAVLELQGEDLPPAQSWLTSEITDSIERTLLRSGAVTVVERRFLAQVFEEIALQVSGAVSDESRVDVGRLSGAGILLTGSVAVVGNDIKVQVRVLEVQSAELREIVESSAPAERLAGLEQEIGARLVNVLRLESGRRRTAASPPPPLPLRAAEGLHRARLLVSGAPLPGQDPARNRRRSDYLLALDLAERALSEQPVLPAAHLVRGIALLNLDDPGRAVEAFETARNQDPDDLSALLWLANTWAVAGNRERAISLAREAVSQVPADGPARSLLGRLLTDSGDTVGAAAAFLEALERAPGTAEAETGLRVLLSGTGGGDLIGRLEQRDAASAAAARLYQALWSKERPPAERDVQTVLTGRPRLFLGPYWAGVRGIRDREYGRAEEYLRTALALHPTGPEVHRELGRCLLLARRCSEGERHVRLYFRTAQFVDDLDELQLLIARCREKRNS